MTELETIQKILDSLINHLEHSVYINVHYTLGLKIGHSPEDYFLSTLRNDLKNDFNQVLFTQIYQEAFYTGPIPKNRNHIAIICNAYTDTHNFPEYKLWIDLDKIATTLGQHYQMLSSSTLFITKDGVTGISGTMKIDNKSLYSSVRSSVNSNWNPQKTSSLLLLGTIFGGVASGYMLLIGLLALASLIAVSSTGIGLLFAGAAVAASVATYCFFQQNKKQKGEAHNDALHAVSADNLKPISIETAFKNNVVEKNKSPGLKEQSSQFSPA